MKSDSSRFNSLNEAVITRYVAVIAIFFVSIRLITHYIDARYSDVLMNALFILGILFTIYLLKKKKVMIAKVTFSVMFIWFSLTLFYLRGLDMVPWLLVFPVGTVLLYGVMLGILWCGVYAVFCGTIYYFIQDNLVSSFSLKMFVVESITAFVVSIAFAALYEYMKSHRIRKLVYISNHDMLTGLYNRHFFYEYAMKEVEKSKRFDKKLSLLTIDIDYFKEINDNFGHAVGDSVLKLFSSTINAEIRKSDAFARLGGDEFVILLFDVGESASLTFANKIIELVRSIEFTHIDGITVSIGIAAIRDGDTLDSFMKRSDDALYEAKREGRDRLSAVL